MEINLSVLPSVLIVIPTYNRESYITQCLDSIINQTYKNIKILIVDDASTDNTLDVLADYVTCDTRIKVRVHSKNSGGSSKALDQSMRECECDFYTWIGSDDAYEPNAIESFVNCLGRNPSADYVYADFRIVNSRNTTILMKYGIFKEYDTLSHLQFVYLNKFNPIPWNGMWRTQFLKDNDLGWLLYQGNDWSDDVVNGLLYFSYDMVTRYVPKRLIRYRMHEAQGTHDLEKRIKNEVVIINAIFEWYGPEAYLGRSASPMEVHFEYLTQMRKIILSYTRQFLFGDMAQVQPHIQYVAKHSLKYMDSYNLIDDEMFKNLKFFFKSEGGKVNV